MPECAYCGEPVEGDGVSPDDDRTYCTPMHAAKHDHNPEPAEMQQAGLPGAASESQAVPTDDEDEAEEFLGGGPGAAMEKNPDAEEFFDPDETPETTGGEPDEQDANPGVDADKPTSTTGGTPWDEDAVEAAVSELDPSSPVVDTSGWPQPDVEWGARPPVDLRKRDLWLVWSPAFGKTPMAPWQTDHCYPVQWGEDVDTRPETDYETVKMVAEMDPERVHESYPFPPLDGEEEPHVPDELLPTVFMPHDPPEPPIMLIDLDDVRDPENGAVTPEAMAIVRRLDCYTEVSSSGTGLHIYARAQLPGALGKYIADLEMVGHIEMYDHGRFVGATWDRLVEGGEDLEHVQGDVDYFVEKYETEVLRDRREGNARAGVGSSPTAKKARRKLDQVRQDFGLDPESEPNTDSKRRNAFYHKLDIERVARHGRYGSAYFTERENHRGWLNGPHPGHGPEHSDIEECTNFGIKSEQWSCFAHEGGSGGALSLLAVVDSRVDVSCDNAKSVHDDPTELLKTCLIAREEFAGLGDAAPPYTALVGIARQFDLAMKDSEEGILGEETARIAATMFEEMEPSDVEQ